MDTYSIMQLIHILAASIWIGGHIVILLGYIPRVLRTGQMKPLKEFEEVYEKIALPSLLVAVATGLYMGIKWSPVSEWFTLGTKSWLLGTKAVFFLSTILLAVDARLRVMKKASRGEKPLLDLALHVVAVTIIAVGFAVAGWALRYA